MPHVFHDQPVNACLPNDVRFGDLTFIYSRIGPIRSNILNRNNFKCNLDVTASP